MKRATSRVVETETLSEGWLETVHMVNASPEQTMFHTMTSIRRPLEEVASIRKRCDSLLAALGMAPVETVANTIFPKRMADASADPQALSERYRAMYPTLRRWDGNRRGTYFGRIVDYPGTEGSFDQLDRLVAKLRNESAQRGPMASRYEVNIAAAADLATPDGRSDPESGAEAAEAVVVHTERDNSRMGFPCLSLCSFQLDHGTLHLLAHYRYEFLIKRGYGNYLGLARLQQYVADQCELDVGELTIVTGRAQVDTSQKNLNAYVFEGLFDVG